jgi:hypothetical protein
MRALGASMGRRGFGYVTAALAGQCAEMTVTSISF